MMASKVKVVDYLKSKEEAGLTWTAIATGTFFDLYVLGPDQSLTLPQHPLFTQLSFSWVLWP